MSDDQKNVILTSENKEEGRIIAEMITGLPLEEKKQVKVYIQALHDRQLLLNAK